MIGLVLGDTHIGNIIIKKLKKIKKRFIIIDISKKKIFSKEINSFQLSIGELGKCISILNTNKCKQVLFAGRIDKPNFKKTKFDFKALYHLPKIIRETKKGDAYIINFITSLFQKEGFNVISQTKYNPEIVLKKGCHTKLCPTKDYKKSIRVGKKIINDLSLIGTAQGVVVVKDKPIISENIKGTDIMLRKAKKKLHKHQFTNSKRRAGILVKLPKPNQDLRTDLPTIGISTLKLCAKIGLKGIVVKSKHNIFLDKKKCINLANKKKMFIFAI